MIDWTVIDTVLLDMDGTLLDLHFDNHFWFEHLPRRYATHHGCTLAEAQHILTQLSQSRYGTLDWYCLDFWSARIGMDIQALKQEVRHLIRFRPGTLQFLDFLRQQRKRTLLVTNAHPKTLQLKLDASGLGHHLSQHISSHQLQLAKENVGFWPRLRRHADLDYTRALFIDDSLNVLRRARAEGLPHTLQVLQPDTTQAPQPASEFPGLLHFEELLPA